MTSIEYDLRYLTAVIPELKEYLLSKELFWPVTIRHKLNEPPFPKLTPSNMLLPLARLNVRIERLSGSQDVELQALESKMDILIKKWSVKWEEKCQQEFGSRLRQWQNFINELYVLFFMTNAWHDIKPSEETPDVVNALIEISIDSITKYEFDKESGLL